MTPRTILDTDSYRSGLVRFRRSLTTKDRVVIGSMFGFVAGVARRGLGGAGGRRGAAAPDPR